VTEAEARDTMRRILAEQGMDVNGASPHSWRCEHPDRYPGYCTCVDDLITAIIEQFDLVPKVPLEPANPADYEVVQPDPAFDPVIVHHNANVARSVGYRPPGA